MSVFMISIHAPRVGSDGRMLRYFGGVFISIHAPRVGSDLQLLQGDCLELLFQSTLPVWGATGG